MWSSKGNDRMLENNPATVREASHRPPLKNTELQPKLVFEAKMISTNILKYLSELAAMMVVMMLQSAEK